MVGTNPNRPHMIRRACLRTGSSLLGRCRRTDFQASVAVQCSASGGGIFFLAWLLGRDRRAFSTVRGLQKDFNFFAYQGVRRVVSNLVRWLTAAWLA